MMVGEWTVMKPSRSDEVLEAEQQQKIAAQIRAHFDSIAPKRPAKPSRSESDSPLTSPTHVVNGTIPELHKLRALQSQSQSQSMISTDGDTMLQEEFVETHYYMELGSIDKQHHTTGTGFIKVEKEKSGVGIQLQRSENREMMPMPMPRGFKSNPATNDWIPSLEEDEVGYVSSKPSRSESC